MGEGGADLAGQVLDVALLEGEQLALVVDEVQDDLLESAGTGIAGEIDEGHAGVDFEQIVLADRVQRGLHRAPVQRFRAGRGPCARRPASPQRSP